MSVVQPLFGKTVTVDVPGGSSSNSGPTSLKFISYTLNTNGTVTSTGGSTLDFPADWIDPKIQSAIDSYYVSANVFYESDGTWSGDSISTWISTDTTRIWSFASSSADASGRIDINISPNSNGNPIISTGIFVASIANFDGGGPTPPFEPGPADP